MQAVALTSLKYADVKLPTQNCHHFEYIAFSERDEVEQGRNTLSHNVRTFSLWRSFGLQNHDFLRMRTLSSADLDTENVSSSRPRM